MSIDVRTDVVTRRILAQGPTPEEWAVEVAQPVEGVWTTTFYVGVQSFRLADGDDAEAEQYCTFIGTMFVKALHGFLETEGERLLRVILKANDQLFDSRVDDPQHQVDCLGDTLPQVFLSMTAGHAAALETLQTVVRVLVEPEPPVGVRGAFSEDLYNEDGTEVTVEQARERNPEAFK